MKTNLWCCMPHNGKQNTLLRFLSSIEQIFLLNSPTFLDQNLVILFLEEFKPAQMWQNMTSDMSHN